MNYFSNKNNFFHGIMFHHFHNDENHKKSQGSISKDSFRELISFIGKENILSPDEFILGLYNDSLIAKNVCLTFDDGIKSQIDVALPLLEDLNLKAFFFVQSSIMDKTPEKLEIYRYFRSNFFATINSFYEDFYLHCGKSYKSFLEKEVLNILEIKKKIPVYSLDDIRFRLVRDKYLTSNKYDAIMNEMFKKKGFKPKEIYNQLIMDVSDLKKISNLGHTIGLHSHTHPMLIENMNFEEQKYEYENNLKQMSLVIGCNKDKIDSMSHPCGSYNSDTLDILEKLNIKIGFKQIMTIDKQMKKINNSKYEIAREDHANIIKMMHK